MIKYESIITGHESVQALNEMIDGAEHVKDDIIKVLNTERHTNGVLTSHELNLQETQQIIEACKRRIRNITELTH